MTHLAARIFARRLRGFRVVDLLALGCVAVLATGVYLAKAGAGREAAAIAEVDTHIDAERRRVRLLRAELAHLEQPGRLERLSGYLGLAPARAEREAPVAALSDLAHARDAAGAAAR